MYDENNQMPKEYEAIVVAVYNKIKEDEELKKVEARKKASAEITAKLELMNKIGNLKDKMKKISWWKLNERRILRIEIFDLEGELRYG